MAGRSSCSSLRSLDQYSFVDYSTFARDRPDDLAKAIEHGIPHALRGMMWQLMSASKDTELESTYADLLKEKSAQEKAILRDLGRYRSTSRFVGLFSAKAFYRTFPHR